MRARRLLSDLFDSANTESESAVEAGILDVDVFRDAKARTEFDEMRIVHDGNVVLQLVTILNVVVSSRAVAAADECAVDINRWSKVQRISAVFFARKAEANFVDDFRANDLRVRKLHLMFGAEIVRGLRGKAERPDAIIQFVFPLVLIAERGGVVRVQLVVEARAETGAGAWTGNRVRKFDRVEVRVQHWRIDDGKFVDVSAIEIDEERCFLAERAAEVSVVHFGIVPRLRSGAGKWIARVQPGGIAVNHELAVEFVGPRLGKHFDPSKAEVIVFRGKWILIDANFANGRFGRQLAARETVDINLSAVWSSGGAGECL